METMRLDAEIVLHPEGTYVATCTVTPGCLGTGPTPKSALRALHETVKHFLKPALKHCSQVEISVLVAVSDQHACLPQERKAEAMPLGRMRRSPQQ